MNWHAHMIAADEEFNGAPLLRNEFALERDHGAVTRATLNLSAFGVVEAWLNGRPVSDDVLTPGWSSYEWRLRYATYDVTELIDVTELADETSVLGLALGNGWFRGRLGWSGRSRFYGDELGAFAQLDVEFADGFTQTVSTDQSWSAGPSAVLANDLYDGETIDARRRDDSWLRPGFAGDGWVGVHALPFDTEHLAPYTGPRVTRWNELPVREITTSPSGKTLVDFGQNLRLGVDAPGDHERYAQAQGHGETARAKRRIAEDDHRSSFGGPRRAGPISGMTGCGYKAKSGDLRGPRRRGA